MYLKEGIYDEKVWGETSLAVSPLFDHKLLLFTYWPLRKGVTSTSISWKIHILKMCGQAGLKTIRDAKDVWRLSLPELVKPRDTDPGLSSMRAENSVPRDSGELDGFYLLLLLLGIPWVHWFGSHGKIHGSFLSGSSANFLEWRFSPAFMKGPLARENLKSVQKSRMTLSVRSGQETLFCYQVTMSYEQTLLELFQPQLPHLQINSFSLLQRLNVRGKVMPL